MSIKPVAVITATLGIAVKAWICLAAFLILWDLYQINKEVNDAGRNNAE
jgi:hypothetical protein